MEKNPQIKNREKPIPNLYKPSFCIEKSDVSAEVATDTHTHTPKATTTLTAHVHLVAFQCHGYIHVHV